MTISLDYSNLNKDQKQRLEVIEDRLRGASGRMPSVPSMQRRLTYLKDVRPKVEGRTKMLQWLTPIYMVALFAIMKTGHEYWSEFVPENAVLLIYAILVAPALWVTFGHRLEFVKIPANLTDLEFEAHILKREIEQRTHA